MWERSITFSAGAKRHMQNVMIYIEHKHSQQNSRNYRKLLKKNGQRYLPSLLSDCLTAYDYLCIIFSRSLGSCGWGRVLVCS